MTMRILVIGGYGNFGQFIAQRLSCEPNITVIVAGRSAGRAKAFAQALKAEWAAIDVPATIDLTLASVRPDIVIHTSGPFQGQGYEVAEACIRHRAHYIDLADGRAFVKDIVRLDKMAMASDVLVVSGASSVPGLTSAIIDHYLVEFESLDTVDYGIATAQKTNRGLATTKAVLSYAGRPFTTLIDGKVRHVHGWQGLHWRRMPELGWRAMCYCDVPDLDLFPIRYPTLKTVRFCAGLELPIIHVGLWMLTWLVRIGAMSNLQSIASPLLSVSRFFDLVGTDVSGFFMEMIGRDKAGRSYRVAFDLVAKSGDGPMIPCVPAIVAALGLAHGEITVRGARPCLGLFTLGALLDELRPLDIHWSVVRSSDNATA
jgi:saccharopine dehydrogenase-like NADP-dependent oxidoreductase